MQFLLLTTNRFGVLSRITSIVSSFGINIERANVHPVADSSLSLVHLVVEGSEIARVRLLRKLSRLVDVVECSSTESDIEGEFSPGPEHTPQFRSMILALAKSQSEAKCGSQR
jgi:acetolactate synthase small subunit